MVLWPLLSAEPPYDPGGRAQRQDLRPSPDRLQNPPANVLSVAVMESLQAELDAARDDGGVRVIVIAAAGKLFSAGHDLKEMTAHRADADRGRGVLRADIRALLAADAVDRRSSQAGHRRGRRDRDRGRVPAGRLVRPCHRLGRGRGSASTGIDVGLFCATPAVALTRNVSAQARDGHAADRRDDRRRDGARISAWSTASCRASP